MLTVSMLPAVLKLKYECSDPQAFPKVIGKGPWAANALLLSLLLVTDALRVPCSLPLGRNALPQIVTP